MAAGGLIPPPVRAEPGEPPAANLVETAGPVELSDEFQTLVAGLVRANLPDKFEDLRDWGQTREMTTGLRVRREGLKLETKRKRKEVNDGTWKMYRLRVVDKDEHFQLWVDNARETESGTLAFDVTTVARLEAFGRWSVWERGVQLVSLSAEADARVRLRASCQLALRLDPSRLPPDVMLKPTVDRAELKLLDFRLRRVSDLHGPLVRQLGRALEDLVEDKLAASRDRLPEKFNRQIDKQQAKLRFSLHELLTSRWAGAARLLEPAEGP
ncbi:MAG: hypothetical protein J5I93_22220 [Pirellulaceae bacterium]|nr:hypothetical protein [Pirellulaceae bacterium]